MLRWFFLLAPVWAIVGAAAFVIATIYLAFERCDSGCTGFLEGMNRTPSISWSAIIVLVLVGVVPFLGRWGRAFAGGFVAAFVAAGIATSGAFLFLWGIGPRAASSPADERTRSRGARILELRRQPLDETAGGALIYWVLDCIGSTRPARPADIASGVCEGLRTSLEGYDGPERFSRADPGFRWSYTPNPTGFQVTVYPDAMLSQSYPDFQADQNGQPTVLRSGAPRVPYPRPR